MTATNNDYDVIIIGAGLSGLYQLHKVRELGMSVRVFEAGTDVGGTWYWNRYPGARFDSESWSYGYSWSKELLQEWEWTEHFSAQPETLRYVNYVADKFELRKDISFNARVQAATFDSSATCWNVELEDGEKASARYLITAIGVLSTPVIPTIKGSECFTGRSFHTAEWPHEPVNFNGQRVAVIVQENIEEWQSESECRRSHGSAQESPSCEFIFHASPPGKGPDVACWILASGFADGAVIKPSLRTMARSRGRIR